MGDSPALTHVFMYIPVYQIMMSFSLYSLHMAGFWEHCAVNHKRYKKEPCWNTGSELSIWSHTPLPNCVSMQNAAQRAVHMVHGCGSGKEGKFPQVRIARGMTSQQEFIFQSSLTPYHIAPPFCWPCVAQLISRLYQSLLTSTYFSVSLPNLSPSSFNIECHYLESDFIMIPGAS